MKLSDYLSENGLTQAQFAQLVGASQQAVAMWVIGDRTPRAAQMRKVKDATGGTVTPNDFLPSAAPDHSSDTLPCDVEAPQ
jgi:transcriptional regulator with XRE-family HTH domain